MSIGQASSLLALLVCFASPPSLARAQARPYALPFQLRPAIAPNVLRVETSFGGRGDGWDAVMLATVGVRASPEVSLLARAAYAVDVADDQGAQGALGNPLVGALYTPEVAPGMRLALFGGVALPLGQGDGLAATSREVVALASARVTRGGMDNPLFATNHATVAVGLGWLYLVERFTFQLEATLSGGLRARGGARQDAIVENLTAAAWIAYSPIDALSLGVALHHQRFLSEPAIVRSRGEVAREQTSASIAVRGRLSAEGLHFNPGVSYTRGIEGLMDRADLHVVSIELLVQY